VLESFITICKQNNWAVILLLFHQQLLKIEKFGKTFDQLTKETVNAFLVDSKKSNFKI